jgi:hypothetical protein
MAHLTANAWSILGTKAGMGLVQVCPAFFNTQGRAVK